MTHTTLVKHREATDEFSTVLFMYFFVLFPIMVIKLVLHEDFGSRVHFCLLGTIIQSVYMHNRIGAICSHIVIGSHKLQLINPECTSTRRIVGLDLHAHDPNTV